MKFDVIIVGGATEDITFNTEEGVLIDNRQDVLRQKLLAFEYGAKIKIEDAFSTFGGGAANAAVCISRLGFKVAALISVGDDERGQKIKQNLRDNGVNVDFVKATKKKETGFSFVLVGKNNEHIVFSNRGANTELTITAKEQRIMKQAKWIYLTSISGHWDRVLAKVFQSTGPRIAWNPGHIQLKSGIKKLGKYFKLTEILVVNKDEAIELAMSDPSFKLKPLQFINEIGNLLRIIKSFGPKIAVITNGKNGAHAFDGRQVIYQPIIKVKTGLNSTGAGDAFGSSFVAGLELYQYDIKKALGLSAKNSSQVVAHIGAQTGLIYRKDV